MSAYVQFECENPDVLNLPCESLAELVASEALSQEGCPFDAEICVVLTGMEEIREANREFRGIDRATDVLSFPAIDFSAPSDFSGLEEDDGLFDLDTGRLILGDMMICAEKVRAQAEEYGHSEKREFCFLVAHSMLHLLGYDHMEPEEEAVMQERQERILQSLGITR